MVHRRKDDAPKDVSITTLGNYVDEADEAAQRGGQLWEDLIFRYGYLDALIEGDEGHGSRRLGRNEPRNRGR
jgi:hypothetical protein